MKKMSVIGKPDFGRKTKILFFLILLFGVFGLTKSSFAATYYVCDTGATCGSGWVTGNDSNAGTSKSAPAKTLKGGIAKMTGGDTLVIGDGTYSGADNVLNYNYNGCIIPSGSSGAYTTVMAEHDGSVVIDGSVTSSYRVIDIMGNSSQIVDASGFSPDLNGAGILQQYITIQGVFAKPTGVRVSAADHIKMINVGSQDTFDGNNFTIGVAFGAYNLFEGCYAFGSGRGKFAAFHAPYNIFRNCVARQDYLYMSDAMPMTIFDNYNSPYTEFDNCIAIDGDDVTKWTGFNEDEGAFACATTSPASAYAGGQSKFNQVISLNNKTKFSQIDWNAADPKAVFWNSIGWHHAIQTPGTGGADWFNIQGSTDVNQCTFGDVSRTMTEEGYVYSYGSPTITMKNSIFRGFAVQGPLFSLHTSATLNYLNLYNPTISINASPTNTISTDPLTSACLKYLPRLESGCALHTAGLSGAAVGANIVYQYGKTGSLYGETGYNLLQDGTNGQSTVSIWPFPNEDLIKTKMAAYSNHSVTGTRGFCTGTSRDGSSQTLTKYIWEYLGNQIPSDIYGTSSDTTPPSAPSGLAVN
jgi:hypothetical protein